MFPREERWPQGQWNLKKCWEGGNCRVAALRAFCDCRQLYWLMKELEIGVVIGCFCRRFADWERPLGPLVRHRSRLRPLDHADPFFMNAFTVDVDEDAISECCIDVLTNHSDLIRKIAERRRCVKWTTQKSAAKTFIV